MLNVNIRSKKTEGEVPLFTYLRIGEKNHSINLQMFVDVKVWNEVSISEKKLKNYLNRTGKSEKLLKIEFGIRDLKKKGNYTKEAVDQLVQDIVLHEMREEILKVEKVGKEVRDRKEKSIKTYLENFVRQMESGEIRNNRNELYAK